MAGKKNHTKPDKPTQNGKSSTPSDQYFSNIEEFSKLWQMAFNATSDMISILDINHQIIAVNKAMANALGRSPKEAVGLKCYHLVHNTDSPPLTCPNRALIEDGKTHHAEIYEERLNIWFNIQVTPLYDAKNQLVGSIHVARDITQEKRSEQAFRESEERYHHLSEATMEGVLLSEESTIIATNQVLADMLGYTKKEMTGMNMLKLVASHDRPRLIDSLRNQTFGTNTFDCIKKDETIFSIEAHSRAITYKGAMVYQTAIRDLTEQKRMEQERIAHDRLRGVLEMAGAVSHEINQPLMALQGFMDILTSKVSSAEMVFKYMHKMNKQIARIKKLTHKMMHITKYETKDYAGGQKIIDLDQAAPKRDLSAN